MSSLGRLRQVTAAALFPVSRPGKPRWRLLAGIALAGSALALARLGTAGLTTFWAEDGQVYYQGAVDHPVRSFFEPYRGYWQILPRIIADIVALFPVSWAAAANGVAAALAAGLLAALAYQASSAHIRTPWLRLVPTAATALCPVGDETWGVTANLMWPMYFVVMLVLLWNPRRAAPIAVGTVTTLLLTLTSPFGILFVPVAVARIAALGRDRGIVIPVAALAGTAAQTTLSLLGNGRQVYSAFLPGTLTHNYLFDVTERGFFGERLVLPSSASLAMGAGVLTAVVLAIAMVGVAGRRRQCVLAALLLAYSIGYYVVVMVLSGTGLGGSTGDRYYVGPMLLLACAMVVAFDAAITRDSAVTADGSGPRAAAAGPLRAAAVLCAALTACLAFSVISDWNKPNPHRLAPTWSASLSAARARCAHEPGNAAVRLPITSMHPNVPWYVTLRCSDVG